MTVSITDRVFDAGEATQPATAKPVVGSRPLIDFAKGAGGFPLAEDALPAQEVAIRGRNEPMIVRTVTDARTLSALVGEAHSAAA